MTLPRFANTPHRVLAMDDDPAQLRLMQAILAPPAYAVVAAADGRQGVERLHGEDFDVVLLDKYMPLMDGHAVLRHIRQTLGDTLLPVIMVTGHGDRGDDLAEVRDRHTGEHVARILEEEARRGWRDPELTAIFLDILQTGALHWDRSTVSAP